MRGSKRRLAVVTATALIGVSGLVGSAPATSAAASPPLWVQHVLSFPGGISNGVRARLAAPGGGSTTFVSPLQQSVDNVQANADCDPAAPQNETSVAFNLSNTSNAVAAANDYCGDGDWIGATTDGGQTWTSTFKDPKISATGGRCYGGDPSVVFSRRDHAFYLSTLCFFSTSPISELQVWKSTDGGFTWTNSHKAALALTNRASDGSIDGSVFYDKELLAVDNDPSSPHYGRLYLTYIKFHMLSSGRSDYCPAQLLYTDRIPTRDPRRSTWTHTAIVPDMPGDGVGPGANQWALPVVDDTGALAVSYVSEDCNTAYDRAMYFTRSTDGGASFSAPVRIDKPGQFADNPNTQDILPAKHARIPMSPSMAFDPTRHRLLYAYQNYVDARTSGADISLQTSDDYGATWSNARPISVTPTGAAAPNDQFFPWLAVDPQGIAHAIWFDNRNDPGDKLIETFQGTSTDGGLTWANRDISSVSWNPDASFYTCGCFIGDYNGLAAAEGVTYPVWTDGRNTPGQPMGQTDIFTNLGG
jgi:hypothetical protein